MIVLVINAGSSTLKSQLIQTDGKICLMKALAEKIGDEDAFMNVSFPPATEKHSYSVAGLSIAQCLVKLLDILVEAKESPIHSLDEIEAIGNRVVSGGEYFTHSTLIDDAAFRQIKACEALAPLHNPPADACIELLRERLPGTPQVAVFDTAFHQTMPPKAYLYPLPMRYYEQYHIRLKGAQGTSHRYAAQQAA